MLTNFRPVPCFDFEPVTEGGDLYSFCLVSEFQDFGAADFYGVPAGRWFVVGTVADYFAGVKTVAAYLIYRDGVFETYNRS